MHLKPFSEETCRENLRFTKHKKSKNGLKLQNIAFEIIFLKIFESCAYLVGINFHIHQRSEEEGGASPR